MLLTLTAYVIIPIYTLLFVSGTDWFSTNLSVIGSWPDRRFAFAGLGLILGLYFYIILKRLMAYLPRHKREDLYMNLSFLLLILAVATPYLPRQTPLQSFLHIIFAFLSSVLLLLCLYRVIWMLSAASGDSRKFLKPYRITLLLITFISGLLLLMAGIISSALEVFFILSSAFLVQRLYRKYTFTFFSSRYTKTVTWPDSAR